MRRIVQDDHTSRRRELAEEDAARLSPRTFRGVGGRIVSQEQHIEVIDADPL